jgi:glycoprotein endo-alpha-1,2-mannosidase
MRAIGTTLGCLCAVALLAAACGRRDAGVDHGAHAFYYGWYASETVDGAEAHWNHEVLGAEPARRFPGGDDIGANYYPALGAYSSRDPRVLATHARQCREAGIGVLVASWWGIDTPEDAALPALLDAAAAEGLSVAIHLEPFPGRDAETSRDALAYLVDRYGGHPALHRPAEFGGRPFVYVYDSYLTPHAEWARLLAPEGDLTVRGTSMDVVALGLWVEAGDGPPLLAARFDGWYTYFASDGFTWGSTAANWPAIAAYAELHGKLFVPCVGPGYLDTRIRPWNAATTRPREEGRTYDRLFAAAIALDTPVLGITSFNEWHEGTQIEPAVPKSIAGFVYEDYEPLDPDHYLRRTRHWLDARRRR